MLKTVSYFWGNSDAKSLLINLICILAGKKKISYTNLTNAKLLNGSVLTILFISIYYNIKIYIS